MQVPVATTLTWLCQCMQAVLDRLEQEDGEHESPGMLHCNPSASWDKHWACQLCYSILGSCTGLHSPALAKVVTWQQAALCSTVHAWTVAFVLVTGAN